MSRVENSATTSSPLRTALRVCDTRLGGVGVQVLDAPEEDEDSKDWAAMEDTSLRSTKAVVIKTSTRQVRRRCRRHHAPFAGHAPSCASVHTSKRNLS